MIELPPPDTKHWTVRRKAAIVEAVRIAAISLQVACLRYDLSVEEFLAWQRAVERQGLPGLRATRRIDCGSEKSKGRTTRNNYDSKSINSWDGSYKSLKQKN
jgi:hypothetical protein